MLTHLLTHKAPNVILRQRSFSLFTTGPRGAWSPLLPSLSRSSRGPRGTHHALSRGTSLTLLTLKSFRAFGTNAARWPGRTTRAITAPGTWEAPHSWGSPLPFLALVTLGSWLPIETSVTLGTDQALLPRGPCLAWNTRLPLEERRH